MGGLGGLRSGPDRPLPRQDPAAAVRYPAGNLRRQEGI
jgi:hypothetical protein